MTSATTQLIDVHAHFVTARYKEAAVAAGHMFPDGMPGWPDWDPATHISMMDGCGIGRSVLSVSSPGTHFGDDKAARALAREVNEYGTAVAREHPTRFGHLASLPLPDVEGSIAEARYALDVLRSDGVAVETNADGRYLGDPGFEPLWRELDERGAVVFVHPTSPACHEAVSGGRPRPMLEFIFDSTRAAGDLALSGVLVRHPRIRWIFTHGGGALPLLADRVDLFRAFFGDGDGPSVPELMSRLWFDMAGTPFPNQIPALVRAFGRDRILYGSDYCWTPAPIAAAHAATLTTADQPPGDTWHTLTTRNAHALFPRFA
ncbi:amidohydrolase family protein [Yinghuangia seranimata]|uniref:amidohydrolase family protein n=1 Tax=Yinghuangia seranimata TaxID=408067 RepID=UPI00248C5A46|nr:amidohydrolase family protein [Yinghuangia seranimata]MDI2124744.1 amidohydrolase family protein [Yinghuangia seranimata]